MRWCEAPITSTDTHPQHAPPATYINQLPFSASVAKQNINTTLYLYWWSMQCATTLSRRLAANYVLHEG